MNKSEGEKIDSLKPVALGLGSGVETIDQIRHGAVRKVSVLITSVVHLCLVYVYSKRKRCLVYVYSKRKRSQEKTQILIIQASRSLTFYKQKETVELHGREIAGRDFGQLPSTRFR